MTHRHHKTSKCDSRVKKYLKRLRKYGRQTYNTTDLFFDFSTEDISPYYRANSGTAQAPTTRY